ncbi:molybdopterin-dependent oxidoreductase [Desulfitobacterium sp. Sab5]|uniref:molybdopterin-dependent oxidoreductase n=1 Tax=Desulfitobacterium nosdiversum TaxID=3375356 RepID=UPI003CE8913F
MTKVYDNVCPADCPASCRLLTEVYEGRIMSIKGDKQDPYTQGRICAKGYAHLERVYSSDRVLYPLKQRRKGSGDWERVTWEQALTEIAEKLISIDEEYGNLLPVCLDKYLGTMGILSQSVEDFFDSMGKITAMIGTPCEATGMDALMLNYGANKKPVPEDMLNSKLIIIWGSNPAWTAPHQMRYIFEAQEQGAQIIVIDPVFTATAARSNLYFQIRPGSDGELALGLAKVLLEEDLLDHDFITNYTHGWSEYRNYLTTVDLKYITEVTGISIDGIYALARLYGTIKPATIWIGFGSQRTLNGGQNIRAIDSLAALTGNIGREGGNVHYLTYEPWTYTGTFKGFNKDYNHRTIGTGRFAELGTLDPPIEFLWIAGRNPAAQDPDTTTVKQTLKKIPMVVVADQVLTATALMADYVLPVASLFEFEDIVISFWHYGVAMNEQAIAPLGECKSDYQIMRELSLNLQRFKPGFSHFPTNLEASEWLDQKLQAQFYGELGITHYRELRDRYVRVNLSSVPWQDHQFPTPSGKYEFFSQRSLERGILPLPIPGTSLTGIESYPFRLLSVRSYANLNSQFRNSKRLQHLDGRPTLFIHPKLAKLKAIEEGDNVKVYNLFGELVLRAALHQGQPCDIVVAYAGRTDTNLEELNTLIGMSETDLGEMTTGSKGMSFTNCFVNLVRMG